MQVCQQLFDLGLQEYEKRKAEVDMFWECVNEAKEENKDLGMQAIEAFMAEKKRVSHCSAVSESYYIIVIQ